MIGGGGERLTLRIVARHADHPNACGALGRDPKSILRSANMPLLVSEDGAEVERLRAAVMKRLGLDEDAARDALLAGGVGEIRDRLARLRDAGVGMLWVPTMFLPLDARPLLDRFMAEVAPAFR